MNRQLSVYMPSNRNLERSYGAIATALAFCESRNATLIVSDNSGDPEKPRFWQGRSEALQYLENGPLTALSNALNAMRKVETPFLMPIGDDDELGIDAAHAPVDLESLDESYVGVRPLTDIFLPDRGSLLTRSFSIDSDTPGMRLREYVMKSDGDNTGYYSIFRTRPYRSLIEFFAAHHPTRGAYCDWQLAFALFSFGKVVSDPSVVFRYNASGWASAEAIAATNLKSYTEAGLPQHFERCWLLLRGMDLHVFVCRRSGEFPVGVANTLLAGEVGDLTDYGLADIVRNAEQCPAGAADLAHKALKERNPTVKYLIGAGIAELFVPGLKVAYINFLKAAAR